jgi:hypothetical protein
MVPSGVKKNTRTGQFIYRTIMKQLLDDERKLIAIISFLTGVVLTFLIYPKPEAEEIYKFTTVTETDTAFVEVKDTVYVPKKSIKTEVLRDTILVDHKPTINAFSSTTPFEYGNTYVSGEVLGEVLKMSVTNDFKIPVVTNTVTNTETRTIIQKPKGIYLGIGVNSLLDPGVKASYLDNKYLFQYQYQPVTNIHTLGVSKKLF